MSIRKHLNFIEIKTQIYKIISKNGWLRPLLGEKYFEIWYKYIRNSIFKNLEVRTGPFAGMQYPQAKSAGSSLLPKILGSYEKELAGDENKNWDRRERLRRSRLRAKKQSRVDSATSRAKRPIGRDLAALFRKK